MTTITDEPEAFTVTRHRCPYCRRTYATKKRATDHMAKCWWNKGCKTCRHVDAIGGSWVTGCDAGVNLYTDEEDPQRAVPRSQCPLWEAIAPESPTSP